MIERDPLRPILRRQVRDVNLLYRTLADALGLAITRHTTPGQPVTEAQRRAILTDPLVRQSLDAIYGRYRGDREAAVYAVTVRDAHNARALPIDAAVRDWRDAMPAGLRAAIEGEAQA